MRSRNSKTNRFQWEGQNLYDDDDDDDDDKTTFSSNTLKSHFAANFNDWNYYIGFKN
jgi:hypothetical protein